MKLFFDANESLSETLLKKYSENAELLIPKIREDRSLSEFDRFNKRFKISWGMEVTFTDNLPITKEDTRACYVLMLKISDLWFAFEYLVDTAAKVIPKDINASCRSSINFYKESTLKNLGFDDITSNLNQLMYNNVLHKEKWREEVYSLLAYLANNTRGETKELISGIIDLIKEKSELRAKHIFALAYAIRNIYVHKGVAAALGGKNYQVKKVLYSVVYDGLILYSLALGDAYCRIKLALYLANTPDNF